MLLLHLKVIELHCGEKFDVDAYSFLKGVIEEPRNFTLPPEQCKDVYIIQSPRFIHYVNCFAATAGYKVVGQISHYGEKHNNKLCVTMGKEG